jgi:hypothetical protein
LDDLRTAAGWVAFRPCAGWVAFRVRADRLSFEALGGRSRGLFGRMRFGRARGHRACVLRTLLAGRCAADRWASIGRVFDAFL